MRLAVDVTGQILGGPADFQQHLLDPAALAGVDDDGVRIEARTQHRGDLLVTQNLFEHGAVQAHQGQAVGGILDQLQSTVAGHRVDDVDQKRLRHRVAREADQGVDDLLGVVAGRPGVPQCQRGDPVGVHMFRGALELGEWCDRGAGGVGSLVIDLQQNRLVGLHDQRAVGHVRHYPSSADITDVTRCTANSRIRPCAGSKAIRWPPWTETGVTTR